MNQHEFNEEELDKVLLPYLKASGGVFPESDEEILAAFEKLPKNVQLPDDLKNPFQVIELAKNDPEVKLTITGNFIVEENLSRAAREGGNISEDVKKKMEDDRNSAEAAKNNRNAQSGS